MAIVSASHRRQDRSGYVLIMTLVLIAVAALSLSGLARRSLLLANESIGAERELQRRWGAYSCRRMLLDRSEEIFHQSDAPHLAGDQPWPAPRVLAMQVTLSGMSYKLWLADEDAKLNLNTVTARLPVKRRDMLAQLLGQRSTLQLDPDSSPTAKRGQRWFASWGQMVDVTQLTLPGTFESLVELSIDLTCWGGGKLNIRRASDKALSLVAEKLINREVAQKLIEARAEAAEIKLTELLKGLALKRRDQLKLRSWLTDRSTCYSLWLELEDGQRKWYHQWVQGDRISAGADTTLSFHW